MSKAFLAATQGPAEGAGAAALGAWHRHLLVIHKLSIISCIVLALYEDMKLLGLSGWAVAEDKNTGLVFLLIHLGS